MRYYTKMSRSEVRLVHNNFISKLSFTKEGAKIQQRGLVAVPRVRFGGGSDELPSKLLTYKEIFVRELGCFQEVNVGKAPSNKRSVKILSSIFPSMILFSERSKKWRKFRCRHCQHSLEPGPTPKNLRIKV